MRISIGDPFCRNYSGENNLSAEVCGKISSKINQLRSLSFSQLSDFNSEETKEVHLSRGSLFLTIYVEVSSQGSCLVVVQGFFPTWKFPTYFSLSGVGKMFVDGFSISNEGIISELSDETLYQYS